MLVLVLALVLVLEIPTVKTGRQDSFSRHQSSGTNCYGGKSDSLFAAETQQIEHEHERTVYFATGVKPIESDLNFQHSCGLFYSLLE